MHKTFVRHVLFALLVFVPTASGPGQDDVRTNIILIMADFKLTPDQKTIKATLQDILQKFRNARPPEVAARGTKK